MKRNTGLQPVLSIRQPHHRLPPIQSVVKTISHDGTGEIKIPITRPIIQYKLQPVPTNPEYQISLKPKSTGKNQL